MPFGEINTLTDITNYNIGKALCGLIVVIPSNNLKLSQKYD